MPPQDHRTLSTFVRRSCEVGQGGAEDGGGGGGGGGLCAALIINVLPMGTVPLYETTAGVVDNPSDELLCDGRCDMVIQKPIKGETMEIVAERYHRNLDRVERTMANAARSKLAVGGGGALPPVEYQARHIGHTRMDLLAEFQQALSLGRKGKTKLPGFEYGLGLTTQTTRIKGVALNKAEQAAGGAGGAGSRRQGGR